MRSRILGVLSVTGLAFGLASCAADTPSFGARTSETAPRQDTTGTETPRSETPRATVVVPPAPAPPAVVVAPPPAPAPPAVVVAPPAVVVVTPGSPTIVQPESPEEDEAIPNTTPRHTGRN